jgi:hypothetical protein
MPDDDDSDGFSAQDESDGGLTNAPTDDDGGSEASDADGDMDSADAGASDDAASQTGAVDSLAWQDPSGGGAEQERARVTGWTASCSALAGSQYCRFSSYSIDHDGAQKAADAHKQASPTHGPYVTVTQQT